MDKAHALLAEIFGFDGFRPGQAEVVDAVASGQNTLAIMPTGGGKSLCFQLPALMRDGLTVVISPLIALMRDQVRALREAGVAAGALTSGNTDEETDRVFDELASGALKLLYIAPERLASSGTLGLLRRAGASLIAVDEAHCVSQWGHDFRPDYLRIGALRRALDVPLAAFTATADTETQAEIIQKLFDEETPQVFLHGFDRPNLFLRFAPKDKPRQQILSYAAARRGQSGIVYCGTRAKCETLSKALTAEGHASAYYHGGMEAEDRRIVESRFKREDGLIIVATIAFGMGVDKPDIRWVAHADLPKSIEAYYQEIGRAGRDGAPADTLTLYGADDIRFRRNQIDESPSPPERRDADHGRLNALLGLAEAQSCRRQILLGYFGETAEPCGHCDLCDTPPEIFDGTTVVRKALSTVLRTNEQFGAGHLIDILIGNATDKVRQRGHETLSTFGIGGELKRHQWQAVFRQMMGLDLLRPDAERHGALCMTHAARPILRGEDTISLRHDTIKNSSSAKPATAQISDEDAPMLAALKAKRRALAEAARVPAYVIFPDRTLIEMAERRPSSLDELVQINGIGAKKLERYGQSFLEVLAGQPLDTPHPARRKLAAKGVGDVFDRLQDAQLALSTGADGLQKPMSCSTTLLARVAAMPNASKSQLMHVLGEKRGERFADAFLEVLSET